VAIDKSDVVRSNQAVIRFLTHRFLPAIFLLFLLSGPFPNLTGSPNNQAVAPANILSGRISSSNSFSSLTVQNSTNSLVSNCVNPSGNSEVESAVDPTNGYIYEEWIGCKGIGFARSTDGGLTFGTPITVLGSYDIGGNFSWDPAIVVNGSGVIYASFMLAEKGSGGAPYVAISYDHGLSFTKSVDVSTPTSTEFSDRDFIAVSSNGTIYVTWNYAPNASFVMTYCAPGGSCYYTGGDLNIVISRSTDGGLTWSFPVPISPNFPNGGGVSAPLLVEPNGQIDVLYEDYNIGANHTLEQGYNYFTYSTDQGRTWSNGTIVGSGGGRYLSNTEWWIDGDITRDSTGTLYASFDTPNATQEDAWLTYSSNDGRSWSNPVELNEGINSTYNIMPGVLGTANSSVYVAWLGENSSGWNTYFQVYSSEGVPLTRAIVVSDLIGLKGIWGGDTLGIAGLDNGVSICWGYGVRNTEGGNESEIFASTLYDVTLRAQGSGTVNPSGSNWYVDNSTISISAHPLLNSLFSGWFSTSSSLVIQNRTSENTFVNILGGGTISANFHTLSNNSTQSQTNSSASFQGSPSYPNYGDAALIVIGIVIIAISAFAIVRRLYKER
jgi:hypothetical protein